MTLGNVNISNKDGNGSKTRYLTVSTNENPLLVGTIKLFKTLLKIVLKKLHESSGPNRSFCKIVRLI